VTIRKFFFTGLISDDSKCKETFAGTHDRNLTREPRGCIRKNGVYHKHTSGIIVWSIQRLYFEFNKKKASSFTKKTAWV